MERLKKRSEFKAAAKGRRTARRAFVLETRERGDDAPTRFGFTVTKKLARKAAERNRIRRRLKEAARLFGVPAAGTGCDHVLVGRKSALNQPFSSLAAELVSALGEAEQPLGDRADRRSRSSN
jgi:ribonuclease P protein component